MVDGRWGRLTRSLDMVSVYLINVRLIGINGKNGAGRRISILYD